MAIALGGLWALLASSDPPPTEGASSLSPPRSPTPGAPSGHDLRVRVVVRRVQGHAVAGPVRPRQLAGPAAAVAETMSELYSIGFVDPAKWGGGRFPELPGVFAASAWGRARDDLERLTLGRTARSLDAVRPKPARLDVEFVTDSRGRPAVAFASIRFEGVGVAGDVEIPLKHEGEYTLRRMHGAWRIVAYDVRGRVPRPGEIRGRREDAVLWPQIPSDDPLFVLAIGSDARRGRPVARARADSLHIVAINPREGRATIVGIPRDSFVSIPGVGTAKINEALYRGGPELMVRTVEELTGVRIDAYVLTGFEGFEQMVSEIGGIEARIPYPMSDPYSRAYFPQGPTRLSGREALAFSRNRHDAPGGDFGRSLNQGLLMIAAFRELRDDLSRGPTGLVPWAVAGTRYLRTDLSLTDILDLLLSAPAIDPDRIRNRVVSGHGATIGGLSVVLLGADAQATFRDLARDAVLGG